MMMPGFFFGKSKCFRKSVILKTNGCSDEEDETPDVGDTSNDAANQPNITPFLSQQIKTYLQKILKVEVGWNKWA